MTMNKEINFVLMVFVIFLWVLFMFQSVPIYVPLFGNVAQLILFFILFQDDNIGSIGNPHLRTVTRKPKSSIKQNRIKKLNKLWGKNDE